MSLVCGVYLLRTGTAFPAGWAAHLRENLNRGTTGAVSEYSDERLLIYKLDLGAFGAPAWQVGERHVTTISGDAILRDEPDVRGRADDMAAIEGVDVATLRILLAGSRGYFNLVHYDRADHRLALAVDRVGLRSMYVYEDRDLLVFSGALRLIENLPGVQLTADLRAVMETAAFGAPLAARTRYKEVTCMLGGSQLLAGADGLTTDRYWKFDRDACTHLAPSVDIALDELYAAFQKAVRLRVGRRKAVFSALSGGLDSRSVTTELWRQGLDVHSLNVSWKGSQDDVLGSAYAASLGLRHHHAERPLAEAGNSLAQRLYALLTEKAALCKDLPSTSRQLWSGDGGSTGLGHIKLSVAVVETLRLGDTAGAARLFVDTHKFRLSCRLLRPGIAQWAENLPQEGVVSELAQFQCHEPERAIYLFLLANEQRRMLAYQLEQIDLVPLEFIEPLFDPEVLSVVCKLPMAFCLKHHMYHRWLERFPAEILSVAWQVYPGHEPCPVPLPPGTFDQWQTRRRHRRGSAFVPAARGAFRYLRQARRFRPVLRADRALAAYTMYGLEIRDTSHLLKQIDLLGAALTHTFGNIDLPDAGHGSG